MSQAGLQNLTKTSGSNLNSKQLKLLEALTDIENPANITEACKRVGVSRVTCYDWLKKPEFFNALKDSRNKALASIAPRIDKAMIASAMQPNGFSDRRLFYEKQKEIKSPESQQSVTILLNPIPRPYPATGEKA